MSKIKQNNNIINAYHDRPDQKGGGKTANEAEEGSVEDKLAAKRGYSEEEAVEVEKEAAVAGLTGLVTIPTGRGFDCPGAEEDPDAMAVAIDRAETNERLPDMERKRYGDEEGETAYGKLSKAEAPDVAGERYGGKEAVVVIETEGTER